MKGIVNRVIILFIAVKEIDRATLPLKKYVIRPDVVPPGHAASIINPTFAGRGMLEKQDTINARTGRIIICEARPIIKGFGEKKRFLKLPVVRDRPTPSMINASTMLSNMSIKEYEVRCISNKYNERNLKIGFP
jgi:hypothetical protein